MKKNYFLTLAVFGLVTVIAVAFTLMGNYVFQMLSVENSQFEKYNGIVPILAGMLMPPAVGAYFDRKFSVVHWLNRVVTFPVLIYLSGVVVGVGTNYIVNGLKDTYPMSYVTGPFLALTLYGIPCAVVVGIICFMFRLFLQKKSALT